VEYITSFLPRDGMVWNISHPISSYEDTCENLLEINCVLTSLCLHQLHYMLASITRLQQHIVVTIMKNQIFPYKTVNKIAFAYKMATVMLSPIISMLELSHFFVEANHVLCISK